MKYWILAAVGVLLLLYGDFGPFEPVDAGEMCIVETLFVEKTGNQIRLVAKEAEGAGRTMAEAVSDMEDEAPGRLFLRQVKRVVFCGSGADTVDFLSMPSDIPVGAAVYATKDRADDLLEGIDTLEKKLDVREKEKNSVATLAQIMNRQLEMRNAE